MFSKLAASVLLSSLSMSAFANNTITLDSDPGDYIGGGQTYVLNSETASITYSRNYDNGISISVVNLPDEPWLYWSLVLAAPNEEELQPGSYNGAERFPFQDMENPGLSVSGMGRGCNTLSGSFEIYDVEYAEDGEVLGLNASFEQYCESGQAALRGTINYNFEPVVGAKAEGASPYVAVCRNLTTKQRVRVRLPGNNFDCKDFGLEVNSGDKVQVLFRGIAD